MNNEAIHAFQAYASGNQKAYASVTADTPQEAAAKFFDKNPGARFCSVAEGFADGIFFTVLYGNRVYPGESAARWPRSWKKISKKLVGTLPAKGEA